MAIRAVSQMIGLAYLQGSITNSLRRLHGAIEERKMPIIAIKRNCDLDRIGQAYLHLFKTGLRQLLIEQCPRFQTMAMQRDKMRR